MNMTFEKIVLWMNTPLVHVGGTPLTMGGMAAALLVFLSSFIVSGIVQRALSPRLEKNFKFSSGMAYAVLRMTHYIIIVMGVIISTQMIGLNLGSLAVVFGFLSVGIGFGLQNITSNFIAGIILLIERPISVGDFVNVEGQVGRVVQINMRSTLIMTVDNVAIIAPNSKFVENNLINWSIQDKRVRLHCPVGVAYGSDIVKVKKALMDVAHNHEHVLDKPEPEVRFLEFGDSSLNFDLLVWTDEPKNQFVIKSQINYAIDEAFRKVGIKIPFPQRDLHLQLSEGLNQLSGKSK